MRRVTLGIDPGAKTGLAVVDCDGLLIYCEQPKWGDGRPVLAAFELVFSFDITRVVIEMNEGSTYTRKRGGFVDKKVSQDVGRNLSRGEAIASAFTHFWTPYWFYGSGADITRAEAPDIEVWTSPAISSKKTVNEFIQVFQLDRDHPTTGMLKSHDHARDAAYLALAWSDVNAWRIPKTATAWTPLSKKARRAHGGDVSGTA